MDSISNKSKNSILRAKIIITLNPYINMIQIFAIIEMPSSEIHLKRHNSALMNNLNNI